MKDVFEYGEDDYEDDVIFDEEDEIRMAILEAETNEIWLEEPGDEDEEPTVPMNPLFGLLSAAGSAAGKLNFPGISLDKKKNKKEENEDPEH
jgi:hypothetical protein